MIDTHCHLLPSLDDGPRTEAEALELARRLEVDGVRIVVCTPHFSSRFPTSVELSDTRLRRLRSLVEAAGIPLGLHLAAEVSPSMALAAAPKDLLGRTVGDRYLLLELQADTDAKVLNAALERLDTLDLRAVLAHPERSRALRGSLVELSHARAGGAVVQVVAPSLAGRWGAATRLAAWEMIDEGIADVVASDAHHAAGNPLLAAIGRLVAERYGEQQRHGLLEDMPRRLLGLDAGARTADGTAPLAGSG